MSLFQSPDQQPFPVVVEYAVASIRYIADEDGNSFAHFARSQPDIVNTVDIENRLHQPNTFLVSWVEQFFERTQYPSRGEGMVVRWGPKYLRQKHELNQALLSLLKDKDKYGLDRVRSLERILFDLGWRFDWQPTGQENLIGARVPTEIWAALADESEIKILSTLYPGDFLDNMSQQEIPVPASTEGVPSPQPSRLDALELQVERLTHMMQDLVGAVQGAATANVGSPSDDFRNRQRRTAHVKSDVHQPVNRNDATPATDSML